ncbi:MAG: hypothetical protein HOY71_04570, partial [Nonomuraea sp.]|nr:hypothetical protein [Nonomuraea sp.]
ASSWDWSAVHTMRTKEEAGHEEPWYEYLAGRNPSFPERILSSALEAGARRVAAIEHDPVDIPDDEYGIHYWQDHNPVLTEALLQLTTGSPQILYNGALAQLHVRYFAGGRPGLPEGVAALVSSIEPGDTVIELVNLGEAEHTLTVQAGAYGEHVVHTVRADDEPPRPVEGPRVDVRLPGATRIRLTLAMTLRAARPAYGEAS